MTDNSSRQFTTADDIFAALDKTRERLTIGEARAMTGAPTRVTDMVTCENKPQIRTGDRVMHKDGRKGTVEKAWMTVSGWQAVAIRWDGSRRVPTASRADKVKKIEP